MEKENKKECSRCLNTGIVKEKDGSVHTCFECLQNGNLDQHDKNFKDSNIRL